MPFKQAQTVWLTSFNYFFRSSVTHYIAFVVDFFLGTRPLTVGFKTENVLDDHVNSVKTVYDNWVNEFVDDWVDGNGAIGDVQDLMTRLGHGMITWEDCNTLNLIQYNETEDIIPPNIDEGKNQKAKESVHRVYGKHCRLTFLFLLPPSNLFHCYRLLLLLVY